jgi:hypothetical protein
VEAEVADDLAAFGRAAEYAAAHAAPGEAVLPFPAVAGLLYAAGLTSPVPHDYWFPGRPSRDDERRMLETLRAEPPRLVTTLNDGWTFFIDAPEYFTELRDFVVANYDLVARFGRFDVLARADIAPSLPRSMEAPPAGDAAMQEPPASGARAAAVAWLPARRQAAERWMAHVTAAEVRNAALPEDVRTAVLLLRALRDGGDLKGAGWLIAGISSTNPRIRREAESAMERLAQDFEARRFRWADDFDAAEYRTLLAPYAGAVKTLAQSPSPKVQKFAAVLAYVFGQGTIEDATRRTS